MLYLRLRCFWRSVVSSGPLYRPLYGPLSVVALWLCLVGCSKEEVTQAFNDAKAKTQELAAPVIEKVEQVLPESGSLTLEMTPAVEMEMADIHVFSIGDGRPNVVQVVTYDPDAGSQRYPRLMLHGTTAVTSAAMLVGKSVPCDMYFQSSSTSPVAMTQPGNQVSVSFDQYDSENATVQASLGSAELLGSDGKTISIRGGVLIAVVQSGGN